MQPRITLFVGIVVLSCVGALYTFTLAPSVMPGDYAEFQMCAAILGIPHPTGYPLYILLGKLFTLLPFGDVAYRVNLSSAVYMAGAAAMLYAISVRLLSYLGLRAWWWLAAAGAAFFALSPTVWSMALVARSYALNALLVSGVVFSLITWRHTRQTRWFYAVCALIGLSLVHHGTTYLLLPAYALYIVHTILDFGFWILEPSKPKIQNPKLGLEQSDNSKIQNPKSKIVFGLLAFLAGLSPMLFLVYRFLYGAPYYWGDPTTWKDFFNLLTGGPFHDQVLAFGWGAQLDRFAFGLNQLSGQYSLVGILVGLLGLAVLWRNLRAEAALLTLMVIANFGFAMNYALVGYLYFIPTYLIWGILISVGLAWLGCSLVDISQKRARGVSLALRWGIASVLAVLAITALATRISAVSLRNATTTRDQALALLKSAPQGASLYMDWEDVSVIRFYRLVYGMRTDMTLHTGDPADWAKWAYCDVTNGVPTYIGKFAGAEPAVIARDFVLESAPIGWRVVRVANSARYEVPPCGACATCR